jgi:hypothetical protein
MAAVVGQLFLGALYAKSILKIHYGSVYMMLLQISESGLDSGEILCETLCQN